MQVKTSKNIKETQELARLFFKKLKPSKNRATVVALLGDLGAGKTTFVQFLAKEFGIKRKVNSPTFVIIKKYPLGKTSGVRYKYIFHIDAYRLKNEKELTHLGWDEIIREKENLVFIEWPEIIAKALPKKHHQIHISHVPHRSGAKAGAKQGHRKFKIKNI